MNIVDILFIDADRCAHEFKKVLKKEKQFEKTFETFKKSLLVVDDIYSVVRECNSFRIINRTECNEKIFWKAYIRDKKFNRMIRIIFFIKKDVLYIIEMYHKENQSECDKRLFKKYCKY